MGNRQPNTIVGLDLSIRSTGWCVYYGTPKNGYFETGTIGTKLGQKKKLLDRERYLKPYDTFCKIREWIESEKFNRRNTIFVIEDFIGSGNGSRSVVDMAELGGLVKGYLEDRKYTFYLVSPGTWKKFIHKGNMRKPKKKSEPYEVGLHVYDKYGVEFETTDETDAYSMVRFIMVCLDMECALDEKQQSVVDQYMHEYEHGKPPKKKKRKKKNGTRKRE
jgi:hypothetical protein